MKKKKFIKTMAIISVIIAILALLFATVRCKNSNTFVNENMNTSDSYSLVIVYNNYNTSKESDEDNSLLSIIIQIAIKYFLDKIRDALKNNDNLETSKKHIIIIKFRWKLIIMTFTINNSIFLHIYIIYINKKP